MGILPFVARGWSLGGLVVRLNHDDIKRRAEPHTVYYLERTLFVLLILAVPSH